MYNWKRIDKFIEDNQWRGAKHFKVGHNKFSDWTEGEYQKLLGFAAPAEKQAKNYMMPAHMMRNGHRVADSIDWRDYGYVGEVQDQGMCGADWAFTANGAVQGAFAVQQGKLTELSVQQLVDCTGSSTGCSGGTMSQAFDYLETSYAMTAADYPYQSAYPARNECKYDESKATTCMVDSYTYAEKGDIDMMKKALSHQPIAASLNASSMSFQTYLSGVYDDETCDT